MKTTLIGQANRELSKAKRELDRAKDSINDELRRINKGDAFAQCQLWSDLYYAFPNSKQIKGYLVKLAKFTAKYPQHEATLSAWAAVITAKAQATEECQAGVEKARVETLQKREAKAADKGDQNLIAALAGPREDYRVRCVDLLRKDIETAEAKLAKNGHDLNAAYPSPVRGEEPLTARFKVEARRFVGQFFRSTGQGSYTAGPYIVVRRDDNEAVISALADKMVSAHFDGYIYKLSHKIGKPVATATHTGSIWTNCVLVVTCQDGETQTWHTQCIFNTSVLGRVFNQWPTRRQS